MLVGCGAAGAIGGAFNAPLTGAFYAFELVIGTYTLATFAPVAVASIVAVFRACRRWAASPFDLDVQVPTQIEPVDYIPILALGMVCALIGIAIMRGVTLTEALFRRSGVPVWLRPASAALAVGVLALVTPAVLSSGHGALGIVIECALHAAAYRACCSVLKAVGLGDLDRLRLPRRAVLRLAVPGRADRQAVRRRAGDGHARRTPCPPVVCCAGRHERAWRSRSSAGR